MPRRATRILCGLILCFGTAVLPACAHDKDGHLVVPQAERDEAAKKNLPGPTQNTGIRVIKLIGTVELGREFTLTEGRQLRARELVIEPGGVVAVHQHNARPGMAYILEGEIVEHRNDQLQPLVRKPGDAAFEKTGVSHWWENRSQHPVRALVVDIVPVEKKPH